MVYSTKKAQPIAVTTYLSSSDDDSESNTQESSLSTAVKMHSNTWHVVLENVTIMTVRDNDLMDTNKFYVQQQLMSLDNNEMTQKKQAAKQKWARKAEKLEQEKEI